MEVIVSNPLKMDMSDIDASVSRVKILLLDKSNRILLCNINGSYSFVGGHVEPSETVEACFEREMLEETGIVVSESQAELFLKRQSFEDDYFGQGIKCLSEIYYYAYQTGLDYDLNNMQLDADEVMGGFRLEYVDLNNFEKTLLTDKSYKKKKGLYDEMIEAVRVYKQKYVPTLSLA